eukprot:m.44121 g.44121  ORF g.44121 m.44121 type:complete len:177 (-) comp46917_c0_seq2:481-1011(-)
MSQGMGSPVLRRFLDLHASVRAMQQGAYIHHWEQDLVPRFFQLDGRCRSLSWRANEADSHIIDEVQLSDLIDLDFGETFALADLESQASTYRHTKEVLVSPFLTLIAHTQAIRLVFSSWRCQSSQQFGLPLPEERSEIRGSFPSFVVENLRHTTRVLLSSLAEHPKQTYRAPCLGQ